MTPAPPSYRPDIDGLRAIAVLVVVLFHGEAGLSGGYVGVDIFFVISGYLISGLILKQIDGGEFRLRDFWERRVRRIFPALALVVAVSAVAGFFLLWPQDFKEFGQSLRAQALMVSNFYFWAQSGYFESATETKPLLHTWSLAVEEQFYLLFPLALLALTRISRRATGPVIAAAAGVSFGLCVYASYRHPVANFYLLPTRTWELLLGALLAALPAHSTLPQRWKETLGAGGLVAILYAVFVFDRDTLFPGAAALLPGLGTAAIISAGSGTPTLVGRLLSFRPLVFVGLISYSLYLWHWPALAFARYSALDDISTTHRLLLLAACGIFATLSWRFVETPVRQKILLRTRTQIFTCLGICTVAFAAAGWIVYAMDGLPAREPEATRAIEWTTAEQQRQRFVKFNLSADDIRRDALVELGAGGREQESKFLLWGDSHGMAILPALDTLCRDQAVRGVAATHFGRAPLLGFAKIGDAEATAFGNEVLNFVRRHRISDVLLVAHWKYYLAGSPAEARTALLATVAALKAAGAHVWIMKDVPVQRWPVQRGIATTVARGGNPDDAGLPLADHLVVAKRSAPFFDELSVMGVSVIDPLQWLVSPGGRCRITKDGVPLYFDDNHLSTEGALMLRGGLEPIFNRRTP